MRLKKPSGYELANDVIRASGKDPEKLSPGERFDICVRHILLSGGAPAPKKSAVPKKVS